MKRLVGLLVAKGPFNSWDRQPFLTSIRTGHPSLIPAQNNITRNFFFNSYSSSWPIDHDDGSAYYLDSYNLLVYGGYKNFLGHSKVVTNNLYVHPDWRARSVGPSKALGTCVLDAGVNRRPVEGSGWGEVWSNNTCIFDGGSIGNFAQSPHVLSSYDNRYLVSDASNVTLEVGPKKSQISLAVAQKTGLDLGSSIAQAPSMDAIIAMGKALIHM